MNKRAYTGNALDEQDAIERRQQIRIVDMRATWAYDERRRRRSLLIAVVFAVVVSFVLGYLTGAA